jgi:hypothetical protein
MAPVVVTARLARSDGNLLDRFQHGTSAYRTLPDAEISLVEEPDQLLSVA